MNENDKSEAFFDKVIFGGYDTVQVDGFVGEAKGMILQLKKENSALTRKLRILAEKLEEMGGGGLPSADEETLKAQARLKAKEEGLSLREERLARLIKSQSEALSAMEKQLLELSASPPDEPVPEPPAAETGEFAADEAPEEAAAPPVAEQEKAPEPPEFEPEVFMHTPDSGAPEAQPPSAPAAEPLPPHIGEDDISSVFAVVAESVNAKAAADKPAADSVPEQAAEEAQEAPAPVPAAKEEEIAEAAPEDADVQAGQAPPAPEGGTVIETIDTAGLTYEEALALVLSKNGIEFRPGAVSAAPEAGEKDRAPDLRIEPKPPTKKNGPAEKKDGKKPGIFGLIKKGISTILEDDEDDDFDDGLSAAVFDSVKSQQETLKFGKDYDVRK